LTIPRAAGPTEQTSELVADERAAPREAVSLNLEALRERLSDAASVLTEMGQASRDDEDDE
jgi:hypothetical protein